MHAVRVALSSMIHFVRALQSFAHLEVVDCSFSTLEAFALRKEGDLDALIAAHEGYVDRLAGKILMRGSSGKVVRVASFRRGRAADSMSRTTAS